MAFTRTTLIFVSCDGCGKTLQHSAEEFDALFCDEQEALDAALEADWAQVDGKLTCWVCVRRQSCLQHGHTWEPWQPMKIGTWLLWRACTVCDAVDHSVSTWKGPGD